METDMELNKGTSFNNDGGTILGKQNDVNTTNKNTEKEKEFTKKAKNLFVGTACILSSFFSVKSQNCEKTREKPKWMVKFLLIVFCVLLSLAIPILIQGHLNVWFRDMFNPEGWMILRPNLRIASTLLCYCITEMCALFFLRKSQSKKWLFKLQIILTFMWSVFIAMLYEP